MRPLFQGCCWNRAKYSCTKYVTAGAHIHCSTSGRSKSEWGTFWVWHFSMKTLVV